MGAVAALTRAQSIVVLGSAALLVRFPHLGEAGGGRELTRYADLLVSPSDEQLAAMVHEALGEGSLFDQRNGYHVDLLRPGILTTVPQGWRERAGRLGELALVLAPEDVAALARGREALRGGALAVRGFLVEIHGEIGIDARRSAA